MTTYINIETNFDNYKTKYFKLPIEVMESTLIKAVDKLIYSLVRNRLNLSIKHHTYDDKGYYVYYTQQSIAKEVGVTKKTVTESFKRLIKANFLYCEEDGNANKIYICEYEVETNHLTPKKQKQTKVVAPIPSVEPSAPEEVEPPNVKSYVPDGSFFDDAPPLSCYAGILGVEITPSYIYNGVETYPNGVETSNVGVVSSYVGVENTPNNIINKPLYKPNNKPIYHSSNKQSITKTELEGVRNRYFQQLEFSYLDEILGHSRILPEMLDIIVDMHLDETTMVNGQGKDREVVRGVLAKLTPCHIEDIINTYNEQYTEVKYPHAYLKTLIYNTAMTLTAKTDNRVKVDMTKVASAGQGSNHCQSKSLLDQLMEQEALGY